MGKQFIHHAFNTANRAAIREQLLYWHAPEEYISAVLGVMMGHVARVYLDGELSEPVRITAVFLQSDALALFLFVVIRA